ncbi:MAG: hypothetical protein AB9M60_18210 [Leptothrix sp. (in: b-proteobacteria)]
MFRCNLETPAGARRWRHPARDRRVAAFWLGIGLLAPLVAAAAPPRQVEAFDAGTWASWQQGQRRPAIVVFTSTDCAHCPAALAEIERQRRSQTPRAELRVVVMDAEPGDTELLQHAPYRVADRLLAFDGAANKLRYSVNPRWIGVTPYVALLPVGAAPTFTMGVPDASAWAGLQAAGR